jgi:hypothetical protein
VALLTSTYSIIENPTKSGSNDEALGGVNQFKRCPRLILELGYKLYSLALSSYMSGDMDNAAAILKVNETFVHMLLRPM